MVDFEVPGLREILDERRRPYAPAPLQGVAPALEPVGYSEEELRVIAENERLHGGFDDHVTRDVQATLGALAHAGIRPGVRLTEPPSGRPSLRGYERSRATDAIPINSGSEPSYSDRTLGVVVVSALGIDGNFYTRREISRRRVEVHQVYPSVLVSRLPLEEAKLRDPALTTDDLSQRLESFRRELADLLFKYGVTDLPE